MNNEYTFEIGLLGVPAIVNGKFDTGQPSTSAQDGIPPSFEIESIIIDGREFEKEYLTYEATESIELTAFSKALAEAEEQQCKKLT